MDLTQVPLPLNRHELAGSEECHLVDETISTATATATTRQAHIS
jgi:hypothetical protein